MSKFIVLCQRKIPNNYDQQQSYIERILFFLFDRRTFTMILKLNNLIIDWYISLLVVSQYTNYIRKDLQFFYTYLEKYFLLIFQILSNAPTLLLFANCFCISLFVVLLFLRPMSTFVNYSGKGSTLIERIIINFLLICKKL